jgi:hypothetical protein
VRSKELANRPKDLATLPQLLAALEQEGLSTPAEDDPFAVEFRGGLLKDHTLRQ